MNRPFMASPVSVRYLYAAGQREREDAFWPGKFAQWRTVRRRRETYTCAKHATQEWLGGYRFFTMAHWSMRDLRCGEQTFRW